MKRKCEFDEETVECPLCNELLSPPIHQCQNGHMGCRACCEKLKGKECPTCRAMPFAHSRCLGLEKIVESLRIACLNAAKGCTEMMKLSERAKHATEACAYRQFQCSEPACSFEGSKRVLPEHFKKAHNAIIARCQQGIRSKSLRVSWRSAQWRYILFVVEKEMFVVNIHYVSQVPLPAVQLENQLGGLIMFCCSSFGNDSLRYNFKLTVNGKDRVSSTSRLDNVLAFNNQMLESTSEDWNLLLLPNVNPRPNDLELSLRLTLL